MGTMINPRLHIDQVLTQMAIGYRPSGMIADRIAPIVSVGKQSDFFTIFSRADALRVEDSKRAPGTEAHKITRDLSSGTYYSQNYALKMGLTIEDRANADPAFRQQIIEGRSTYILDKLMLDWEVRLAALITVIANLGSGVGVSSEWDAGNADVLGDMNTAIDNIHDLTGMRPNRAVLGQQAWRSMRRSTDVLNRLFGTNNGGGYATTGQVASLLDLDGIDVGGAYQNTANEAQAETLASVWADDAIIYFAPQNPSTEVPSAFYSFRWAADGLHNMTVVRHPYDTRKQEEEIEAGYYQDEVITAAEYAFILKSVNSST